MRRGYCPELNPTEAIGEELRPLYENAECVRRLVSHPWLVEQANTTATENSAITCSKRYNSILFAAELSFCHVQFFGVRSPDGKNKTPENFLRGYVEKLAATYSRRTYRTTTIGKTVFDGRVRNGIGSDHSFMATKNET